MAVVGVLATREDVVAIDEDMRTSRRQIGHDMESEPRARTIRETRGLWEWQQLAVFRRHNCRRLLRRVIEDVSNDTAA